MLLNIIKPFYFFISFAIGILFVYLLTPKPEIVYKFPSPYNSGSVVYKDKNDTCYIYKATREECPLDSSLIKQQPISDLR
jgi:hypothetical protein